jgi:hypothetical protein
VRTLPRLLAVAFLVVALIVPPAVCQNTSVPWYALDGGFAISSSSSTWLASALGQSFIQPMQRGNTMVLSGFLAAPAARAAVVSVPDDGATPHTFALLQNYPNPFNPATTIRFEVAEKTAVTLTVFSVLGQEVQRLVNDELAPGLYDARFDASALSSGVYFYTLKAGSFLQTRKLLLLR